VGRGRAKGVAVLPSGIPQSEAKITNDDVLIPEHNRVVPDTDAVAWGGLAGDGQVVVERPDGRLEGYSAGDAENHDPWPLGLDGCAKAAVNWLVPERIVISQGGHSEYLAPPASKSVGAEALSAREGGQ